jgi:hypothetical protein
VNRPSNRLSAAARAALLGVAVAVGAFVAARPALGATAVLAKNGTMYEVFPSTYGAINETTDPGLAAQQVLALRVTPPGGRPEIEIVAGTSDRLDDYGESIEFEDVTQTVFVVYTRLQGFFSDVRVAARRDGVWAEGNFLPNPGYFISMNPHMVVTRQTYRDSDAEGNAVFKTRSILSIVWWEETTRSQARYGALFIEDGSLRFDDFKAYNLNELSGAPGDTDSTGIPTSAYVWPSVQRDPASNGGVIVSFANLSLRKQQVLRVGFPDDLPSIVVPAEVPIADRTAYARGHTPIGRGGVDRDIPSRINLTFNTVVNTALSPSLVPTYYWQGTTSVLYLQGDNVARDPLSIPLRRDFSADRAIAIIRDLSDKN